MSNRRINLGARAKAARTARGARYRDPDFSRAMKAKNLAKLNKLKKPRQDWDPN